MIIRLDGKARLGSSDDKIELDVQHSVLCVQHTERVLSQRTDLFYKGVLVEDPKSLQAAIHAKG